MLKLLDTIIDSNILFPFFILLGLIGVIIFPIGAKKYSDIKNSPDTTKKIGPIIMIALGSWWVFLAAILLIHFLRTSKQYIYKTI